MGKGTISKKGRTPSIHSRAARRATDIDIDTDKSLKEARAPTESVDHRPSVLSIHQSAGISKKTKKGRSLSSKARKRQEKSMDRAAAIMERTEHKVAKSKGQGRAVQTRRKNWDDINKDIPQGSKTMEQDDDDDAASLGEDMDASDIENNTKKGGVALEPAQVPLPAAMEDIDEGIL